MLVVTVAGIVLAVGVGAALQRVSGMGLGLIAGPALSLLLGPTVGILMVNVLAAVNAAANTVVLRKAIDWRRFVPIAVTMVCGALPAALLIRAVSSALLLVLVGVLLLIALSVVTLGKRYVPQVEGALPAGLAGAVGGFMNTLAGVAGPAITVYTQAARWPHHVYAATLQPLFLVSGLLSFLVKEVTGAANLAQISPTMWCTAFGAMVIGIVAGAKLAPRVKSTKAHKLALTLAFLGGITALVRGLVGLF